MQNPNESRSFKGSFKRSFQIPVNLHPDKTMFGVYQNFRTKIMEIKGAEINAHKN